MSKIKKLYEKHQGKLIIALSVVVVAVIGLGVYKLATNRAVDRIDSDFKFEEKYLIADYMITGSELGQVGLVEVKSGAEVNLIDLRGERESSYIYARSNDLDKLYAYGKGERTFYEIWDEGGFLNKKEIVTSKDEALDVSDFRIEGDKIVSLGSDGKTFKQVLIEDGSTRIVSADVPVEKWLVAEGHLVFTSGTSISKTNILSGESKSVDIGEVSGNLHYANKEIIVFNKFGKGNDTSIMLRINLQDLFIKNLFKFNSSEIEGLSSDSDDEFVYFIDSYKRGGQGNQVVSKLHLPKMMKDSVSVATGKTLETFKYSTSNSLATKGYMYTFVDGKVEVLDLKSKQIACTVELGNVAYTPVLK